MSVPFTYEVVPVHFPAIEPSAAVSQVKLTSVLIVLPVITECSWSSAVSSLGGISSLRLSFLPKQARSISVPAGGKNKTKVALTKIRKQQDCLCRLET